jgi:hypothetical protein
MGDEQSSAPTATPLAVQLANQIGQELEARRDGAFGDDRSFADHAVEVLEKFSPAAQLTPDEIIRSLFTDGALPRQEDPDARFGDMAITLFNGREFNIVAIYWLDSATAIHQHGISGAFQVLAGSSLHACYRFERTRDVDDHVHLGKVELDKLEVLEFGDVRPVLPGGDGVHALWHLLRPSVSFVVREYTGALRPYAYRVPCLEFDPFVPDDKISLRLEALRILSSSDAPTLGEMIEALGRDGTPMSIVRVLEWVSTRPVGLQQRLVDAVRERDGGFADALDSVLDETHRRQRLQLVREQVHDADQRLLLGMLLHCPDRDQIIGHVGRLRPTADPAELISGWIASIVNRTHGVEISPAGRATLTAMLDGDLTRSAVDGQQRADAKVLRYITGRSRVFAPLFKRHADAPPLAT